MADEGEEVSAVVEVGSFGAAEAPDAEAAGAAPPRTEESPPHHLPEAKRAKVEAQPAPSSSEPEPESDLPPKLFPAERVYADETTPVLAPLGLSAEDLAAVDRLMAEPTALEVVECLRLVSLLQTSEVEETWAAVRNEQGRRLRAETEGRDAQLITQLATENAELKRRTDAELLRLAADIQRILQRAGFPCFEPTTKSSVVARQRAIIRALLAANVAAHTPTY